MKFFTTEQIGPKRGLTPEGYLVCYDVPLARTGMMIYGPEETPLAPGPEGVVKIFREDVDVFREETIASALGKSVTNDHPDEDVTPGVWKELSHGMILNVRRGEGSSDDLLLADLLITTPEGIKAINDDKREVSLGYDADYIEVEPGVGRQTNIIINHVALVEQGRCGPRCAIKDHKLSIDQPEVTMKRKQRTSFSDKLGALLRRAYRAKDEAELKEIVENSLEEIHDEDFPAPKEDDEIHIHLDGPATDEDLPIRAEGQDDQLWEQNAAEHAEMTSRIEALESQIAALVQGSAEDEEGEAFENDNAMEEAMLDEIPEELQEEASKAKDSRYLGDSFRETVSMAEVLSPGIKFGTFDGAAKPSQTFKRICGLRRKALDGAMADPATRLLIEDLLAGKTLDTKRMTCDAVRVLFRGAYSAKRRVNNTTTRDTNIQFGSRQDSKKGVTSLAELNKLNQDHYKA